MEDHISGNQQPETSEGHGPKNPKNNLRPTAENLRSSALKKRNPNWGGRRPGAGAPKGNLNGFKHGGRSRQLGQAVMALATNPKTRDTLVALARRAGLEQAKADEAAARFLINAITKGVKITNPEQARAITDLIRELSR